MLRRMQTHHLLRISFLVEVHVAQMKTHHWSSFAICPTTCQRLRMKSWQLACWKQMRTTEELGLWTKTWNSMHVFGTDACCTIPEQYIYWHAEETTGVFSHFAIPKVRDMSWANISHSCFNCTSSARYWKQDAPLSRSEISTPQGRSRWNQIIVNTY